LSIIKAFELSFELSWNVMKDYLTNMGINGIIGSKGAIRHAFQNGLIDNGQTWLEMIDDRNEVTHTYDLETADSLTEKIIHNHYPQFLALAEKMESMN
jgi:nucleotidyltransferase substrate binding protein (TIGR01987 family)